MELGYINGKFVELDELAVPIEERGHQFGDGVYEVIRFYDGKPFMLEEHLERLIRSAEAIKLPLTETIADFRNLILSGVERSELTNCNVYIQITRGIAVRNHLFPNVPVSISMTIRTAHPLALDKRENGVEAITHPDERWANCYIKSLNLLPNILAKQTAFEKGCYEAILIKDGHITEGTSSNVFIVKDGEIITTPLSKQILPGITRIAVKNMAEELDIPFIERNYQIDTLMDADEVFVTSTTSEVLPVVNVDGKGIGNGVPGEIVGKLYAQLQRIIQAL